jgi:4-hydroxybutyryl-CoA dehydratase/vinylacetyl-CoA-Delta-isomerase
MRGNLPAYFSSLHRQSKCACSAGHADLMAGTCSLPAKVNGLSLKVSHINDKITDIMMMAAEVAFGYSLVAALNGRMHPSGVWIPSVLIANAGFTINAAGSP